MKIGLITTLDTNIGDDFIRLGIQKIIRALRPNQHLSWVCINKHQPQTVWPYWHPVRHLPEWVPNYHKAALKLPAHRFAGSDLIVQCGAPVLWKNCHRCEWNIPLWDEVVGPIHRKVPVLNLAVGSAFDMTALPKRVEIPEDRDFLTKILGFCRLTTARDPLARDLCGELGFETPLVPCTAGLAFDPAESAGSPDEKVLYVNYMPKAGHYDFSNSLKEEDWEETVRDVVGRAAEKFQVVFLCHSRSEQELATRVFPEYPCILPKTVDAYADLARKGALGFFNRLHAAVAFAGIGVPSVAVGNDTRIFMVREYGIPAFDVRETNAEEIWLALMDLDSRRDEERRRLLDLRGRIFKLYQELLTKALTKCENGPLSGIR